MRRLYARHSGTYTVSELCGLFGKTKQAYYKHDAGVDMRRMAIAVLTEHGVDLSETIHHSDRGTQYTSADYIEVLHQHKISISMTETGNPKDNPEAERINNTLKNELFKDKVFHNIKEVRDAMASAVSFYNRERPHRSIEMLTPVEAANRAGRFKRGWKSYREIAIEKASVEDGAVKNFFVTFL